MDSSGRAPGSSATSATSVSERPRLHSQARPARRKLDRPAELLLAHRADQDLVRTEEIRQLGELEAPSQEVGTDTQDRAEPLAVGRRVRDGRDEGGAEVLVVARGKHLRSPAASRALLTQSEK